MIATVGQFSNGLEFERNDKFGWLTANIETLGSGICCKICLKLKQPVECIKEICETSRIQMKPIKKGENGYTVELTNRCTFGMSEFECVKAFYDSVKKIIQMTAEIEVQNNEPCKNAGEANIESIEVEKEAKNEQTTVVDDDEAKNEECNDSIVDEENHQNEVSNTEEDNNEIQRVTNPTDVANIIEDNFDNNSGEKPKENTPENDETKEYGTQPELETNHTEQSIYTENQNTIGIEDTQTEGEN